MRVLLLVDRLQHAETRSWLEVITGRLDPRRIQPVVCAARSKDADICLGARSLADPRLSLRLRRVLRAHDFELIHALEPGTGTLAASAGRLAGVPAVLSIYTISAILEGTWGRWQLQRWRWRSALSGMARAIVPFEAVRRKLLLITRYPRDRIAVIYPGYDPPPNGQPPARESLNLPDGPLVTMIPEEQPDPGYEHVFDVLQRVLRRHPAANLVVAGSGPAVSALQRVVSNIRPAPPIRWLGNAYDPWALLAVSDVFIDCALKEHLPQRLMMAALAGKPIVASRLVSIEEVVEPNVTGLLVSPGDSGDMAVQVGRLLQYEGLSHRLGRMARRRALERFSVDAQAGMLTNLYESTIYSAR